MHGPPPEVLERQDGMLPDVGPGQVHVAVRLAPIHPSDLNKIAGTYGKAPTLPAVGGTEGVGQVQAVGAGVTTLQPGQWVCLPAGVGTWREAIVEDAEKFWPVPEGVRPEQAATLAINPPTAWRLLHDFADLRPGEWIVQNAANSAVGRCVIEIAKARGWRTLNFVRRTEVTEELRALGADAVLPESPDGVAQARRLTGEAPVRVALNAVGGESALRLSKLLTPGGTLVTYGAMSKEPVQLANRRMIFDRVRAEGFWLTAWKENASAEAETLMRDGIVSLMRQGKLQPKVEKFYPLEQAAAALRHAESASRSGKIFFKPVTAPPLVLRKPAAAGVTSARAVRL